MKARDASASSEATANRYALTLYDAAYLELAQRHGLPLATLARDLHAATRTLGLPLL